MTGATSDFGLNLKISMKTASALPARNHGVWMCSSPGIRAATLAAARAKTVQKNYDPEFRGVGKNIASTISTTTNAMPKAKMAGFSVPLSGPFAFASSYGPAGGQADETQDVRIG
jgi:hypothetical protein